MYLETRITEEIMEIYKLAWKKGLKTTYYLHMKPRHTAEQSTTTVNKREKMGRVGFGSVVAEKNLLSPTSQNSVKSDFTNPQDETEYEKIMAKINEDPQAKFLCDSCQ